MDRAHPAIYYCPACQRFARRGLLTCHRDHAGEPACGVRECYECQREHVERWGGK